MTYQALLIFVWTILGIVIASCITGVLILFYYLGKSSNRENENLAFVFVDYGRQVSPAIKAKKVFSDNGDFIYEYTYLGKLKRVILPNGYTKKFHRSRLMVYVNPDGGLIANPFNGDTALSSEDRESLIHTLTMAEIIKQAIQAMKGKSASMGLIIAMIVMGIIIIIAGFGWYSSTRNNANSSNTTQVQQQQVPTQIQQPTINGSK